jgi:hypothetical protein
MFPKIPEKLSALSPLELRALAAEIRTAAKTVLAGTPTAEEIAEVRAMAAVRADVLTEADRQDDAAALDEAFGDDDEPDPVAEAIDEIESTDEIVVPDEIIEAELVEVTASAKTPAVVRKTVGVQSKADGDTLVRSGRVTPQHLLAYDGIAGKAAGDNFGSWGELAQALADKSENVRSNTTEKFNVGRIAGVFSPDRILDENPLFNLSLFDEAELTAAFCAPFEPQYDLACWTTDRRPVRNSLASYRAPRGGVTIYPSPSMEDVSTGFGIWTDADDDDDQAEKVCATIECATPVEYKIYGVWRCLTVKNLLAMTFPELVEAYLNRLASQHARLAETQLLEAMATGADTLETNSLGYNASTSITTTILNYLALYQEQQRWDIGAMDAWLPRWVLFALKADLMRRRTTNGYVGAPSDAQINALFSDVGVTPHWYIDTPSWATPVPALAVSGRLGRFPRNLEVLVAPRGKFAVMDRGELSIGVTGNNLYRDNASNAKNEFTFFFENFEGVVNTNSCPAHLLQIDNLCFNGQQIADLVINCEGGDQVGAAS